MKKYTLTNSRLEEIEVSEDDFDLFMEVIKTDNNIYDCKIFTDCGWKYVIRHLEDFTEKNINQLIDDNELDQALKEFFTVHLFGALQNTEPFSDN